MITHIIVNTFVEVVFCLFDVVCDIIIKGIKEEVKELQDMIDILHIYI